jgi:TonB family protein
LLNLELNGAQSPGDGVTPGTSLVTILNLQFGSDVQTKPVSFGITPLEVEHGMTYFYLARQLRLQGSDYVRFLRPQDPIGHFQNRSFYLLFALSVDLDVTVTPARLIDERQSLRIQEGATKKVPLALPEAAEKLGLSGMVRVQVEIQPTGAVSRTNVTYSTLPEANVAAIEAARQWEFPPSLFESDKTPITAYISFTVSPKTPASPAP